jgi:hypothetical protein
MLLGEPDKALHDLALMNDMRRLLETRPTGKPMTLVSAMINVAVTGFYVDTIAEGFRLQVWRESHLAAIQRQLATVNLLPYIVDSVTGERVGLSRTMEMTMTSGQLNLNTKNNFTFRWIPQGWIFQNIVHAARFMEEYENCFEAGRPYISPKKFVAAKKKIEGDLKQISPFNVLASIGIPSVDKALHSYAENQTKANLAFIACALERYRLANGRYPETLDKLAPVFAEAIPTDVILGQPLHYHCENGEKFTLYSIGWNETDDGGKAELDWVWQYPASL